MLVLSRRVDERIRIADTIDVVVLEVRGSRVKLGIQCPREIAVHRAEVWVEQHSTVRDGCETWSI